jgi:hypothetical protein
MRENASIVASLLTRSRDHSPLLHHPSVYSCCLATNEARRCATRHGTARLGSIWFCSARRKHRFVYYCVIVEACFDVTVLAFRKYATITLTCGYNSSFALRSCCSFRKPRVGSHYITVLLPTEPLPHVRRHFYLMHGITGVMMKVGSWGSFRA